jgi:hypothetical protein
VERKWGYGKILIARILQLRVESRHYFIPPYRNYIVGDFERIPCSFVGSQFARSFYRFLTIEGAAYFHSGSRYFWEDAMAIRSKLSAPVISMACLVFLLLSPIRSECKNAAPTPTQQRPCQSESYAWDKADAKFAQVSDELHKMENDSYSVGESMTKTQSLANNLDFFKSYLVNYLNALKGSGALTKEQQDDYNSVAQGLANMTALQSRVAARIAVLKKSRDELNSRIAAANKARAAAVTEMDKAGDAWVACRTGLLNSPAPPVQQGAKSATPAPPPAAPKPSAPPPSAVAPRRPGGSFVLKGPDVRPEHEDKFTPYGKDQGGEKFTFTATSANLDHTRLDTNGKLTEEIINHFNYTMKISGESDLGSLGPGDTITIDIEGSDKRKLIGTGGAWGVTGDVYTQGLDNVGNGQKCLAGAGFNDGYHATCSGHFEFKVPSNATKVIVAFNGSFGISNFATYTWEKPQ